MAHPYWVHDNLSENFLAMGSPVPGEQVTSSSLLDGFVCCHAFPCQDGPVWSMYSEVYNRSLCLTVA